eukprot:GSChrysophyteH1.ASY1.ANO1.1839.1 assembled CDS
MEAASIAVKDLVLVGGGHAHVHTIKMMGMEPMDGVRVTLISRDVETPYSGMIPGHVSGHYSREECYIDLGRLCSFSGVRLMHTSVCHIDPVAKLLHCSDDRGISNERSGITAVKPIDSFSERWDAIIKPGSTADRAYRVAIVGGGAGGTELSFAINQRLRKELQASGYDPGLVRVDLYNRGKVLCSSHNVKVSALLESAAAAKGIHVINETEIIDVFCASETAAITGERYLICKNGLRFPFHEAVWCTDAKAQDWLKSVPGLETTGDGFICVGPTLESTSLKNVFAVGDVAHLTHSPRPKAGVFAVRAGPPLTANIRARLLGKALAEWTPQESFLGIIGTADGSAIASKGPCGVEGEFIWKLKDRIDREWMSQYSTKLPDKEQMMEEMAQLKRGREGSDGSDDVLQRVLKKVADRTIRREEVVSGPGDDAALVKPPDQGEYSVHTIDYFRSFIADPYVFGKIAAVHALSDIHAMNAQPVTALALCVIPYGPESHVEDSLTQLLAGAMDVLAAEGCALVGGHTSEGAEMALGLSVNGTHEHHCSTCSDVTGFGLLGHLVEMLEYNDHQDKVPAAARLNLGDIPTLLGATRCIEAVDNVSFGQGKPTYPLLYDPQTSGGLLASVPRNEAEKVVEKLRNAGYRQACIIGEIVARSDDEFAPLVYLDP